MKIAILGAMPEEIEPLLANLDAKKIDYANNEFYLAKFGAHELIIAYSKIGKVNSTLTATLMIEKFGAEKLIFTGVAGALKEGLKIGEILYATRLVQHDLDITAFGHPHGFVPGSPIFVDTDANLNEIAQRAARELGLNLKSGIIASGDQFVCDEARKAWIKSEFDASAVEMEGASVAQVCHALGVSFCVLRAISDEAGNKAEFDFDEFVVKSAKISANLALKMVELL
ncbi:MULTISPECIES: 5'-methylthioadenosine/adenosylhomocysteine nucleosidase [unclassified Campylobacter]|uniref:5'-methylthioadenosine/adenosylhomocysteine nucleosidase n=1 Tax=unclassified Campylobacter TaxID=2593542 RepID=UPI0022E9FC34|nr:MULTISPECIES: 5'-methylthioadenosine/adenosylhomocysteine nucleosidase [unclassified Campylobacter]MDA3043171.1 5'-methylthioadenosine/adenosylhomocysteine nucleosidase [Campylobacter sp. JMF_09 ED2]MDA3044791.1 5'-methylthioadenosine/adenosylhomocysteine nucleosidase [Campylobacter sp. JMF_07 ED4]MDA3063827.1 5'-methylthioadenosine/adenosylhomocysteine nucleosidase [Campylobacter sp. JMF_11 EL3]MDA3072124.1 5'-methylthioadenosine/adenosylhomocysteine nucleosidase [Campylobacter sp. VBCF_03 